QPGAVVQVVIHTTPAPSSVLDPRQHCATSYRELLERYGPVPASQLVWIAVRLDAYALATASVGGPDASHQAPAVVAALIRRVHRALDRSGMPIQLLDAEGLLDALAQACALGTGERGREDWGVWATARLAHACFWVRQWPAAHAAGALLRALAGTLAATTVAGMLEPGKEDGKEGIERRWPVRGSPPANPLAPAR